MQGSPTLDILSTVEPTRKQYWVYIKGTIFVLTYAPDAKIQAWARFNPTKSTDQTVLTFNAVTLMENKVAYRGNDNEIYIYGGRTTTPAYDATVVTAILPWLDHKKPKQRKTTESIGAAYAGKWKIEAGMQPSTGTLRTVSDTGSTSSPSESVDSTIDLPVYNFSDDGTHIRLKATTSTVGSYDKPVKLSMLVWNYNSDEVA